MDVWPLDSLHQARQADQLWPSVLAAAAAGGGSGPNFRELSSYMT